MFSNRRNVRIYRFESILNGKRGIHMNTEKFSDAISKIGGMDMDEVNLYPSKKKKQYGYLKWGAMVVCFILVIYAGAKMLQKQPKAALLLQQPKIQQPETQQPETAFSLQSKTELPLQSKTEVPLQSNAKLPLLTITDGKSEGMGFEGYMVYDISELVNANPWNENMELSTMPVYKNPLTYDPDGIVSGADFDKMREFLLEVADRFGLDTNTLTITGDVPVAGTNQKIIRTLQIEGNSIPDGYSNPIKLTIKADGLKIEVDQTITVDIAFDPAIPLPDEYNFTYHASYEDIVAAAEYLKTKYPNVISIDNPQVNIFSNGYDSHAEGQNYYIEFFDASGNDIEQIIHYNFNRIAFYCDYERKLDLVRIYQPDLSEKVGNYPIITLEEASELLSNGNYITSSPYKMPTIKLEYVKKVELIYRTGNREKYYMPYYRFYVELPEEELKNGLKVYGAYYVPAVNRTYLSNMPTWNGSFND